MSLMDLIFLGVLVATGTLALGIWGLVFGKLLDAIRYDRLVNHGLRAWLKRQ